MNVTVVGSGNGGLATAFDFAFHGHTVRLFDTPHFPDHVAEVAAAGGIHAAGDIEGFAEIAYSGHDIEDALDGAELVVLVGPAYSTEHQAKVVAPHLVPGQAVLICPASCAEVCAMVSRGLKPSWMHCCVSENAPEMSACDATMAAIVAMTSSGMSRARGASR